MSADIYAVANQKGGVGKTTTAVNLATALASMSYSTLLVDSDPQGNASAGSGMDTRALTRTTADVMLQRADIQDCIQKTAEGYALLPANNTLATLEMALLERSDREYILRDSLRPIVEHYHYVFIDCPPALGTLTLNGLTAAYRVLVPIQCEYYALEGMSSLQDTVERVRKTTNPDLYIAGILRTMFDARNNLARDVSEELERHFPGTLYKTVVPRNVTLAEAPSHGVSAITYDKYSSGALAYLALARELRRRAGEKRKN